MKGDPLNLSVDTKLSFDERDLTEWDISGEKKTAKAGSNERLSEIGHGQALLKTGDAGTPAAVSFARVTQRATVSFAQLRRVGLGKDDPKADAAARALLVALGLHAHQLAFGRGFALRSGAELRPRGTTVTWLGGEHDEACEPGDAGASRSLLESARTQAASVGVPLDGWGKPPKVLKPKENLKKAIRSTWPELAD